MIWVVEIQKKTPATISQFHSHNSTVCGRWETGVEDPDVTKASVYTRLGVPEIRKKDHNAMKLCVVCHWSLHKTDHKCLSGC